MNLYLLKLDEKLQCWDVYLGFVVRAESESDARAMCNKDHGAEGPVWENPQTTTCKAIRQNGSAKIVLASFNAG